MTKTEKNNVGEMPIDRDSYIHGTGEDTYLVISKQGRDYNDLNSPFQKFETYEQVKEWFYEQLPVYNKRIHFYEPAELKKWVPFTYQPDLATIAFIDANYNNAQQMTEVEDKCFIAMLVCEYFRIQLNCKVQFTHYAEGFEFLVWVEGKNTPFRKLFNASMAVNYCFGWDKTYRTALLQMVLHYSREFAVHEFHTN